MPQLLGSGRGPGGHDDVANAAAGALVLVGKRGTPMFSEYVPAPGAGGRPTWSAADIRRFAEEAGGQALGALGSPVGWLVPVSRAWLTLYIVFTAALDGEVAGR